METDISVSLAFWMASFFISVRTNIPIIYSSPIFNWHTCKIVGLTMGGLNVMKLVAPEDHLVSFCFGFSWNLWRIRIFCSHLGFLHGYVSVVLLCLLRCRHLYSWFFW
jgi:hypothetical protein